jgi:hypothetical protein
MSCFLLLLQIIFLQCLAVVVAANLNFQALNPLPELFRLFAPRDRVIIHWPPVRSAKKIRAPVYLPDNSKVVKPFKVFELNGEAQTGPAKLGRELFTISNGKLVPVSIGSFLSKGKGLQAHYLSKEHQKQTLEIETTPPTELVTSAIQATVPDVQNFHLPSDNNHLLTRTVKAENNAPQITEKWRPVPILGSAHHAPNEDLHIFKIQVPETADEVNLQPLNHQLIDQQTNTIDDREKDKEKGVWVLDGKQWKKLANDDKDLEEIRANFKNQNAPLSKAKQILHQTIDDYNVKAYLLPTAHRQRSNDADTAIAGSKQNYQLLKAGAELVPKHLNQTATTAPITNFAALKIDPKELIARAKKQQMLEKQQPEKPSTQKKDLTTQPGMSMSVQQKVTAKQVINNYINHKLKMATAALVTSTHRPQSRYSTVFPVYSHSNATAAATTTPTTTTTGAPSTSTVQSKA